MKFNNFFKKVLEEHYFGNTIIDNQGRHFVVKYIDVSDDYEGIEIFLSDSENMAQRKHSISFNGYEDMPDIVEG